MHYSPRFSAQAVHWNQLGNFQLNVYADLHCQRCWAHWSGEEPGVLKLPPCSSLQLRLGATGLPGPYELSFRPLKFTPSPPRWGSQDCMVHHPASFDSYLHVALLITMQLAWRESPHTGSAQKWQWHGLLLAVPSASLGWTPCFCSSHSRGHKKLKSLQPPQTVIYSLTIQDTCSSTDQVSPFHVFDAYEIFWTDEEDVNFINHRAATTVSQSECVGRLVPTFLVAFPNLVPFVFSQVFPLL